MVQFNMLLHAEEWSNHSYSQIDILNSQIIYHDSELGTSSMADFQLNDCVITTQNYMFSSKILELQEISHSSPMSDLEINYHVITSLFCMFSSLLQANPLMLVYYWSPSTGSLVYFVRGYTALSVTGKGALRQIDFYQLAYTFYRFYWESNWRKQRGYFLCCLTHLSW